MRINDHAPLFPVELAEKDFHYILQSTNISAPISATIHQILQVAIEHGYANENIIRKSQDTINKLIDLAILVSYPSHFCFTNYCIQNLIFYNLHALLIIL